MKASLVLLASVLLLGGCARQTHQKQLIIVAIDTSASIEPEAMKEAFEAVERLPAKMHRGDTLVVMPILGDAENEVQGRIIRMHLPEERQAYDQDIKSAQMNLRKSLAQLRRAVLISPVTHTDIIGTLKVIQQEMTVGNSEKTQIIILSDFLQDTTTINFMTDAQLRNPSTGQTLAKTITENTPVNFNHATIVLGRLRSRDLQSLAPARRRGIECFWKNLLKLCGAQSQMYGDGTGLFGRLK